MTRRSGLRQDTAIGVLFAGTFALGVFLFSTIQGYVADLFSFLFGNVLAIGAEDLVALVILGGGVIVAVAAAVEGAAVRDVRPAGRRARPGSGSTGSSTLFLALVALTIVVSLQAVGIILVVAMLVTPAATAQLLTVRFTRRDAAGGRASGSLSAVVGLYLSYWLDVASGATIVLVQTGAVPRRAAARAARGLLARQGGVAAGDLSA